ncbi:uracil phosphoribosyltransferase [Mycoplasmoides pirum]|uniref:uracil phosphoribosyltransferase n=1 Tax=Mycoplasmoides pirum TaxID=2122 RepID=UPI0004878C66|nr:uracil phosphoribosyltransferase [Mycoplasmoides pirum]
MYIIIQHPLIKDKLTKMRDKNTKSKDFRDLLKEITALMMYEVAKSFPLKKVNINTPISKTIGYQLKNDLVLVPILRAGLGMVDGISQIVPAAKIGHIGLYRDEKTLIPKEYYTKFPKNINKADVLLLDPMLATGNSLSKAIDAIKKTKPRSIRYVGLVGSPEGLKKISNTHPDVEIYLASLDTKLNEKGYITPGLGDAGDRLFGTK